MNAVKTQLRNRIGDQWMNDSLILYVQKEMFDKIENETIMQHFQSIKPHREQL